MVATGLRRTRHPAGSGAGTSGLCKVSGRGVHHQLRQGRCQCPCPRDHRRRGRTAGHECSGANPAIRSTLDLVSHAGRITFTGWPKKETSLPTDTITRKEIDLRGARTSAGEFPEALELIATKKVDMLKLLTKTVKLEEVPETIIDIEKNPGSYMKVVVTME